jgi:hypothetical protein
MSILFPLILPPLSSTVKTPLNPPIVYCDPNAQPFGAARVPQ